MIDPMIFLERSCDALEITAIGVGDCGGSCASMVVSIFWVGVDALVVSTTMRL